MAKVLVVDDDRTISAAIAIRLEHHGFRAHVCDNAHHAADIIFRERPDVIVLDIVMPHYNGLELHECLLTTLRGRRIPVIYLTGQENEFIKRAALALGAAAYVQKPFDAADLIETIQRVIELRSQESVTLNS